MVWKNSPNHIFTRDLPYSQRYPQTGVKEWKILDKVTSVKINKNSQKVISYWLREKNQHYIVIVNKFSPNAGVPTYMKQTLHNIKNQRTWKQ